MARNLRTNTHLEPLPSGSSKQPGSLGIFNFVLARAASLETVNRTTYLQVTPVSLIG